MDDFLALARKLSYKFSLQDQCMQDFPFLPRKAGFIFNAKLARFNAIAIASYSYLSSLARKILVRLACIFLARQFLQGSHACTYIARASYS